MTRKSIKLIHEGKYAAEVPVELIEDDTAWSPYLSPEDVQKRQAFLTETPAWLYFLCEAKAREGGTRLGATASHIIAETFVGLLQQDADSILGAQGRGWAPAQSPLQTADRRPIGTIRDLLLFAVAAPL